MWWQKREPANTIDHTDPGARPLLGHNNTCACVGNPYAHFPADEEPDQRQRYADLATDWRGGI